jgi:hypothetical protein
MADKEEEEIPSRAPITFLDVFENALTTKDKGKAPMGESSRGRLSFLLLRGHEDPHIEC